MDKQDIPFEVSCPVCGEHHVLHMVYDQKQNKDMEQFMTAFGDLIGGSVNQYTFNGNANCSCGKMILGCVTISAHDLD